MNTIGLKIKKLRIQQSVSLRKTAIKAGLSPEYLSQLENGQVKNPGIYTVKKLADALDVGILDLMGLDNREVA